MQIIPIQKLLLGYAQGIFPMSESRHSGTVEWFTAEQRGIIPMNQFHVSSNVKRIIRQHKYQVAIDHAFRQTMEHCANRETTWISESIIESYCRLHKAGYAHSVEVYEDDTMVGGLYGVSLRAAFFGESMFNYQPETSKVALYYCHQALQQGGFTLWDTQYYTSHLAQFGGIEVSQEKYIKLLDKALDRETQFPLVVEMSS